MAEAKQGAAAGTKELVSVGEPARADQPVFADEPTFVDEKVALERIQALTTTGRTTWLVL